MRRFRNIGSSVWGAAMLLVAPSLGAVGCGPTCPPSQPAGIHVEVTRCSLPALADVTARDGSYVEKLHPTCEWGTICGLHSGVHERPGTYTVVVEAAGRVVVIEGVVVAEGACGYAGPTLHVELEEDASRCSAADSSASDGGSPDGGAAADSADRSEDS